MPTDSVAKLAHETEDAVRRRWGGLPTGVGGLEPSAEMVAGAQADADPRVSETRLMARTSSSPPTIGASTGRR